jgi:hypothetical protein
MGIDVSAMPSSVYVASDRSFPRWRFLLILRNRLDREATLEECNIGLPLTDAGNSHKCHSVAVDEAIIQGTRHLPPNGACLLDIRDPFAIEKSAGSLPVTLIFTQDCGPAIEQTHVIRTARRDTLALDFPLDGKWVAANARIDLHGIGMTFAFDFVAEEDMPMHQQATGRLLQPWEFASFGRPLYSPVDGTVVMCESMQPDLSCTPGGLPTYDEGVRPGDTKTKLFGNFLMIRLADESCVILAHLKRESLLAGVGKRVAAGELIGAVGNSGNTSGSHLHIEALDAVPEDLESVGTTGFKPSGIPFGFRNVTVDRHENSQHVAHVPEKEETVERISD